MKMIVGLGNPGREYVNTRHNAGFWVVEALAEKHGVTHWRDQFNASVADIRIGGEKILLVLPQTYMNLSGDAVQPLMHFYKIDPQDLLVIYDDMDLPVGVVRIRKNGSSGGQKGMTSIILRLNEDDFPRIRMGIGRPPTGWKVPDYVTSRPTEDEIPLFKEAIVLAAEAAERQVNEELSNVMNDIHRRCKKNMPKKEKGNKQDEKAESNEFETSEEKPTSAS